MYFLAAISKVSRIVTLASGPCTIPPLATLSDNGCMWPDASQTQELMLRASGGDEQAVNGLLERHRDALRRMVAMRMDHALERRVDASDIVQEVLVEANRRLK